MDGRLSQAGRGFLQRETNREFCARRLDDGQTTRLDHSSQVFHLTVAQEIKQQKQVAFKKQKTTKKCF